LEIGGVADIVNERGSSPAVLFDSVKGYPKGYRVLVNSLGSTKRLGLSLGRPENLTSMEFVSEWRRRSKVAILQWISKYYVAAGVASWKR
jgi:UbiD family decarboxylase